jgi:undecaprenyl-diphosphatase
VTLLEAIVLGFVQGVTEFLPISSTAHLRIVPAVLGWRDPGAAFTAVTQLGTMAAVLVYFRSDLLRISRAWAGSLSRRPREGDVDARLGWYIILGTIPIAVLGVVFEDPIETSARSLYLIAGTLILFGLVMALSERLARQDRCVEGLTARDGILMGLAQALALVPGVSRSGATISAGLLLGLDRAGAARFSFLLSVPAVVLSGAFQLASILGGTEDKGATGLVSLAVATVIALVSGYLSIAFLLRFLARRSLGAFVWYRLVVGAGVLLLVAAGIIR